MIHSSSRSSRRTVGWSRDVASVNKGSCPARSYSRSPRDAMAEKFKMILPIVNFWPGPSQSSRKKTLRLPFICISRGASFRLL